MMRMRETSPCESSRREKEKSQTDDAWSSLPPTTTIMYDESSGTLLHVDTPDDQDNNSDEIELRMAMLWK